MTEQNSTFTQNDANEILRTAHEAVNALRMYGSKSELDRKERKTAEILGLLDKLDAKTPSVQNFLMPPLLKNILMKALGPFIQRGRALKDKYVEIVISDMDNNRYDRIQDLMWLSMLNQTRLQYGRARQFETLRSYIMAKYYDDVANPDGHTGFVPEKDDSTSEIWNIVEKLSNRGLLDVREVYDLAPGYKVAIITMSGVV